jgi:hypothetical protein
LRVGDLGIVTRVAETVRDEFQRTFGDSFRIELLQRAGRGVPRVRKGRFAGGFLFCADPLESGDGQEDLAANLDLLRRMLQA